MYYIVCSDTILYTTNANEQVVERSGLATIELDRFVRWSLNLLVGINFGVGLTVAV